MPVPFNQIEWFEKINKVQISVFPIREKGKFKKFHHGPGAFIREYCYAKSTTEREKRAKKSKTTGLSGSQT